MDPKIEFVYEGKGYTVPFTAYELNCIVLPDGRVLNARSWVETYPPRPVGLREVLHVFKGLSTEEIARQMNGVIAELKE